MTRTRLARSIRRLITAMDGCWLCTNCNTYNPDDETTCLTCGPAN